MMQREVALYENMSVFNFPFCIQDTLSSRAALGLRPSASREQRYLACNYPLGARVICLNVRK